MVKIQRVIERARIILNSDDAVKQINNSFDIVVEDPPLVFDASSGTVIDTVNSVIKYNGHQLYRGEPVTYSQGTAAIPPLVNGTVYYAIPMGNDSFRLATSASNATSGTFITLTGIGSGTHNFRRNVTFNGSSATEVDIENDVLNIPNHNFQTGDSVLYTTTGTAINGLQNNRYYFVNRATADILSLSRTFDDAMNGNKINLQAVGVGTNHILSKLIQVDSTGTSVINANREFINIPGHGYQTGDKVQYKIEAGNTAIPPLTDNDFYYVILQDADTFSLALSPDDAIANTAINITGFGVGNAHSFTRVNSTNVPVCTNYKFKIDTQFVLNEKCRLAVQSFDYVENFNATNCKSVGGVYIRNFSPTDTFSSQGYYKGTLLHPAYFGNNVSYHNNNIEYNSIQLPNNTGQLLQNGLDIFIDSKKKNFNNQDIGGNINEDSFNLSLIIYEVDDYEYINVDFNEKSKNYVNQRIV